MVKLFVINLLLALLFMPGGVQAEENDRGGCIGPHADAFA